MMTVAELLEIHAIEQLKYRYMRAGDTHNWDLMAQCFIEDADVWFNGGAYTFKGRQNIIDFLSGILDATVTSTHIALHPEIKLTSATTATGIWRLQDIVLFTAPSPKTTGAHIQGGEELLGAGYYYDDYVKLNGQWLFKSTGYVRFFEKFTPPDDRAETRLNIDPKVGVR